MTPCPILYAMDKLDGKWKIPIICTLKLNGTLRYNSLYHLLDGVTHTMLSSTLKELEKDGLILRTQYPEIPVRVEYSLSEDCKLLFPAFEAIDKWSRHMIEKEQE